MNKKLKILLISLAVIIAVVGILFLLQNQGSKNNSKINSLIEAYLNSEYKNQNENIAIISVSNKKSQAIVKSAKGNSIQEAFDKAKEKINKYITSKGYEPYWVKLDIVYETKTISQTEFNIMLEQNTNSYNLRKGIILNEDIALLEEELNANMIIDYENKCISLENLNKYLERRGEKKIEKLSDELTLFTSLRFFKDENDKIYKLYDDDLNAGRRVIENIKKEDVEYIIQNASKYLANMLKKDGQFTYGYRAIKNKELSSYNILRHAGSVWSLIVCYDQNENDKNERRAIINKAMVYLGSQMKSKDENTAYVVEEKSNEIKLGGSAISILAMCEYTEKFGDESYIEVAKKLGNGILSMQKEDGSYIHVLNSEDFQLKEEQRTVYYDGEATFALAKLYSITKEQKYLEAAKRAIQYFIDNDYAQYCDHWISYAVNEVTKHVDNNSYYEFGLKNIQDNLSKIYKKTNTSHTNFEMLVQGYELYNRIKEKNMELEYLSEFDVTELENTLMYRANYQLNSYLYPEVAMYLTEPSKYLGTFYIRSDGFRVRIDDIQHSILGYYYFLRTFLNE